MIGKFAIASLVAATMAAPSAALADATDDRLASLEARVGALSALVDDQARMIDALEVRVDSVEESAAIAFGVAGCVTNARRRYVTRSLFVPLVDTSCIRRAFVYSSRGR